MPIRVQVPGHGIVEFPDGTDQGVMQSALLKLTGGRNAPTEVDAREPGMQGTYERGQRTSGSDPWWGGFLTEIDDMMRRGSINTLESMAHPQTLGDFMSLILPSIGAGQGRSITAGAINELPKRSFQALAEAGTEAKGMGGALKVPFKAIGKFKDKLPSGNQGGEFGGSPRATLRETPPREIAPTVDVDPYMPNISSTPDRGIPTGELPQSTSSMVDPNMPNTSGVADRGSRATTLRVGQGPIADPYMPNTSGVPDRGVPTGDLPTPTPGVEVDRYMPNSGGVDSLPNAASTERVPYGGPKNAATQAQTGTLTGTKAPTVEQSIQSILEEAMAPSDSRMTGLPPEATTAGEGSLKQSGKFGKSQSLGQPGGYSSGTPSITSDNYDELLRNKGGRGPDVPAVSTTVGPESLDDMMMTELNPGGMAQQAQDLRAKVGARDAAGQMFGSGSKENQAAIRTMAPGPSRVPTDAVERIERAGRPPGINDDILKQIIAALGVGGAGAASQQDY